MARTSHAERLVTEVENLMLAHLKRFQAQISRIEEQVEGIAGDLRRARQHRAAVFASRPTRTSWHR